MTDINSKIIFNCKFQEKDGSHSKTEYKLDRTDNGKLNLFSDLLLLKVKIFSLNGLRIVHYKNDIFVLNTENHKCILVMNKEKRESVRRFLKFDNVKKKKIFRINRKIFIQ